MTSSSRVVSRYLAASGKQVEGYTVPPRTKIVDAKITGWSGTRKIPKKELDAFHRDIRTIPGAAFSTFKQVVQLDKKYLPQLDTVVAKHGLRIQEVLKPKSAILPE